MMELVGVKVQFFAGLGFLISGEARVMGNDFSVDPPKEATGYDNWKAFPGEVSSALMCSSWTLIRSEFQHAGFLGGKCDPGWVRDTVATLASRLPACQVRFTTCWYCGIAGLSRPIVCLFSDRGFWMVDSGF